MAAYVICRIDVTDPTAYERYKPLSSETVARHGGRFIVRGGATELLEGEDQPGRVVVLEFPDHEAARRWYDSADYAEARAVRQSASTGTLVLVDGV